MPNFSPCGPCACGCCFTPFGSEVSVEVSGWNAFTSTQPSLCCSGVNSTYILPSSTLGGNQVTYSDIFPNVRFFSWVPSGTYNHLGDSIPVFDCRINPRCSSEFSATVRLDNTNDTCTVSGSAYVDNTLAPYLFGTSGFVVAVPLGGIPQITGLVYWNCDTCATSVSGDCNSYYTYLSGIIDATGVITNNPLFDNPLFGCKTFSCDDALSLGSRTTIFYGSSGVKNQSSCNKFDIPFTHTTAFGSCSGSTNPLSVTLL